ncbi:MAG: cytochrome c oxidase subunit II [Acidimicrobiales bacterium]
MPPSKAPSQDTVTPAQRRYRRVAVAACLVLGAAVLAGCNNVPTFGTFPPVTKQEGDAYSLYQWLTIAAIVIGAFIWALIFWCVFRYRRTHRHVEAGADPKQTRYNLKWEVAYTVSPILLVIGIFAYTVIAENASTVVVKNPAINIDVTGFQWGWRFDYPLPNGEHITVLPQGEPSPSLAQATTGEQGQIPVETYPTLVLPENETVQVNLVSNDVVHGFYIPEFLFSRYAQPGVTNRFDFTASRTGTFSGRCTQYCGLYHTEMQFHVQVLSQPAYNTWVHAHQAPIPQGPLP